MRERSLILLGSRPQLAIPMRETRPQVTHIMPPSRAIPPRHVWISTLSGLVTGASLPLSPLFSRSPSPPRPPLALCTPPLGLPQIWLGLLPNLAMRLSKFERANRTETPPTSLQWGHDFVETNMIMKNLSLHLHKSESLSPQLARNLRSTRGLSHPPPSRAAPASSTVWALS